jgi:hypothetical protein
VDATDALASIDGKFDENQNIAPGAEAEEDEYNSTPMIDPDTGIVIDDAAYNNEEDDVDVSVEEMKETLMGSDETFTESLDVTDPSVQAFLEGFDIGSKTEEISILLEENPDTLQATFSALTTEVAYEEFWKRYFYRCGEADEERILAQYRSYREQEKVRAAETRAYEAANSSLSAGLSSVTRFLGGAVKKLVDDGGDDPVAPSLFGKANQQSSRDSTPTAVGSALSFFGSGGRPPFVMNTAVSEDDEDDNKESDDDEELGWDDDDEEDENNISNEGGDDDDADSGKAGQIEFRDAAKEKLQDELGQALSERDALQTTVQMQAEELKTLKEATMDTTGNKQIEALKMQIFEKDSELAALRASLDDTHDEDDRGQVDKKDAAKAAHQDREMDRLASELAAKNTEVAELSKELQKVRSLLESIGAGNRELSSEKEQLQQALENLRTESQSYKTFLEEARLENSALKEELESMREALSKLEFDNADLKRAAEFSGSEQMSQLSVAQQQAADAQARADELQSKVFKLKKSLIVSNERSSQLQSELEVAQLSLAEQERTSEESPDVTSLSSPISSESPIVENLPPVAKHEPGDEDGSGEGWGDDW